MSQFQPSGTTSQLIARLTQLMAEHGDLPVYLNDPDTGWSLPVGVVTEPTYFHDHESFDAVYITSTYGGFRPEGDLLPNEEEE